MKKNILVADDSALMRRVVCDIINSDSNYSATDVCRDGLEAYERIKNGTYDLVLIDANIPRLGGLQLLERLQNENIKANIVLMSALTTQDTYSTIKALEIGALDFVGKPNNIIEAKGHKFRDDLLMIISTSLRRVELRSRSDNSVKVVSEEPKVVIEEPKVVVEEPKAVVETPKKVVEEPKVKPITSVGPKSNGKKKLIALACSTGGPKSLQSVIPMLPKDIDAPMVLVQHMPAGFTKSMADRLNELSEVEVSEACEGDILEKGHVYVAPGGKHMEVKQTLDGRHRIALNDKPAIGGLKPCADVTYESLKTSGFEEIICVVLTGMGADGTKGILSLSKDKKLKIIAQDEKSSVVYGMPKAIFDTGIVNEVVTLTDVAKTITKNVGVK